MKIYIASSWKNQHAVEMMTSLLRELGHEVASFVENNHAENPPATKKSEKAVPFEEWVNSKAGYESFKFDTDGATKSDMVLYISPSGTDAWAEVGAAWASGIPVVGIYAKGEQSGLMRKMVEWVDSYKDALRVVEVYASRLTPRPTVIF